LKQKHCLKEEEYTYTVEGTNERHRGERNKKDNTLDAYKVNCKDMTKVYF